MIGDEDGGRYIPATVGDEGIKNILSLSNAAARKKKRRRVLEQQAIHPSIFIKLDHPRQDKKMISTTMKAMLICAMLLLGTAASARAAEAEIVEADAIADTGRKLLGTPWSGWHPNAFGAGAKVARGGGKIMGNAMKHGLEGALFGHPMEKNLARREFNVGRNVGKGGLRIMKAALPHPLG